MISLLLSLFSGAAGGNDAGMPFKTIGLGAVCNSVAGVADAARFAVSNELRLLELTVSPVDR